MKNWSEVLTGIAIIVALCILGFIFYSSNQSNKICRDSLEIRVTSDSEFKCHKDAILSQAPHGEHGENVLVTCTCKR